MTLLEGAKKRQNLDLLSTRAAPMRHNAPLSPPRTGWPPGLLQDDCYKLAHWFASKPDARRLVRESCARIRAAKERQ